MIIYKDVFNGDELCTDSYPCEELGGGIALQFEAKRIPKGEEDFGISNNDEEGAEYGADVEMVVNIVDAHSLTSVPFSKKEWMGHIKGYMKRLADHIKEHNPDRLASFQKDAQTFVKQVLGEFKEYEFYVGSSMDSDAMVILSKWKADGLTPMFLFWKDGLEEEKC